MNKRMMLCAIVDGSDEDLVKNMYQVPSHLNPVDCAHFDSSVAIARPRFPIEPLYIDHERVSLHTLYYGGSPVGNVGKCHKCGKIYFTLF